MTNSGPQDGSVKVVDKSLWATMVLLSELCFSFLNGPTPASFIVYFRSFQTNIITIFTTNYMKKCPFSIWRRDSNPRPLEHESQPITTRPGLPPEVVFFFHLESLFILFGGFQIFMVFIGCEIESWKLFAKCFLLNWKLSCKGKRE